MDPIDKFREETAKRASQRKVDRSGAIPDLIAASAQYDPDNDQPMTLGQINEAQKTMEQDPAQQQETPKKGQLSEGTIAGLAALKESVQAEASASAGVADDEAVVGFTNMPDDGAVDTGAATPVEDPAKDKEALKKDLEDKLSGVDDLEFSQMMSQIRSDVINNKVEKDAVAKRVNPIDFEMGITTGEFTQEVKINDHLSVVYRTISPEETRHIRVMIFDAVLEDTRIEGMAGEIFGLMQVVASIVQINTNKLPSHMKGGDIYSSEFDEETFRKKYKMFSRYPAPMIHALGTHGFWFDQRVREQFTMASIKNG